MAKTKKYTNWRVSVDVTSRTLAKVLSKLQGFEPKVTMVSDRVGVRSLATVARAIQQGDLVTTVGVPRVGPISASRARDMGLRMAKVRAARKSARQPAKGTVADSILTYLRDRGDAGASRHQLVNSANIPGRSPMSIDTSLSRLRKNKLVVSLGRGQWRIAK